MCVGSPKPSVIPGSNPNSIRRSTMVVQAAVNREAVGSNPTSGVLTELATVAQLAELPPCKRIVVGPTPTGSFDHATIAQ